MSISIDASNELKDFFSAIEYYTIIDLDINYWKESVILKLISVHEEDFIKITTHFQQVLSYYIYQEPEYENYRLNDFAEEDNFMLTESSYFPRGFGKITIKSVDKEWKEIEELSSTTNFYFQVNNKDYFFIEANSVRINGKEYKNLIVDESELKKPIE